jgi:N-acetylmuramoyl-L-alanine amidase
MSKIYIDVGHGKTGEDAGTSRNYNGVQVNENEQVLIISRAARDTLESLGHQVTLSRDGNVNCTGLLKKTATEDWSQPNSNMIASARKCKAGDYDLNTSIHINWAASKKARGYQIIYKTGNGKKENSIELANEIANELRYVVPEHSVYSRVEGGQDFYGALRLHDKTGVIVECVFITNNDDVDLLLENQEAIGHAIGRGIHNYCVNNLDYIFTEETKEEDDMIRSRITINGVKYSAKIYNDRTVELTVSKPFDVKTNSLSGASLGATWWASVLDKGVTPVEYYAADKNGKATKFSFSEIIGVTTGERCTMSNGVTYLGGVGVGSIQAWYITRGTNKRVVGTATVNIEGVVSEETYKTLIG